MYVREVHEKYVKTCRSPSGVYPLWRSPGSCSDCGVMVGPETHARSYAMGRRGRSSLPHPCVQASRRRSLSVLPCWLLVKKLMVS